MKVNGKMVNYTAKVRKKWLIYYYLFFLKLFDHSIGKMFYDDEDRYEGEWKENKKHGQGKNEGFTLWFVDSDIVYWWFKR